MKARKKHTAYFFMVATGVFLSTMDSSMINIALPYIMSSFSTTLAKAEWVVLMYLMTISISLLIWGKLSDKLGKGTVYLVGMLIFSFGCLCCYFSISLFMLIFSRFVQGLGAAMMMSTGPAIIRLSVPREQLGGWLGALGIATSLGLMSGPLFGGFILHQFSWRTIFLLNVPVSFTVFLLGWIFLAGTLPKHSDQSKNFDVLGAVLWSATIFLIVVLLNGHTVTMASMKAILILVLCALLFFFYRYEGRCNDPLLPIDLLKERYFLVAMLCVALSFAVLFFALILMPFYLKYIIGLTFDRIGYMMMAVPVTLFVVSPMSGRLFDRIGAKYLTFAGMFISGCAILLLSTLTSDSTLIDIGWRLSLLGCGQSVFLSPNTASVLARVSFEDTGISAGMLATCRNMGMLVGVALVGMIFTYFFTAFSGGGDLRQFDISQAQHFLQSFRFTLYCAAALAFIGSFICLQRQ